MPSPVRTRALPSKEGRQAAPASLCPDHCLGAPTKPVSWTPSASNTSTLGHDAAGLLWYEMVVVEDLNVVRMLRHRRLAQSLADQALGTVSAELTWPSAPPGARYVARSSIERWAPQEASLRSPPEAGSQ